MSNANKSKLKLSSTQFIALNVLNARGRRINDVERRVVNISVRTLESLSRRHLVARDGECWKITAEGRVAWRETQ